MIINAGEQRLWRQLARLGELGFPISDVSNDVCAKNYSYSFCLGECHRPVSWNRDTGELTMRDCRACSSRGRHCDAKPFVLSPDERFPVPAPAPSASMKRPSKANASPRKDRLPLTSEPPAKRVKMEPLPRRPSSPSSNASLSPATSFSSATTTQSASPIPLVDVKPNCLGLEYPGGSSRSSPTAAAAPVVNTALQNRMDKARLRPRPPPPEGPPPAPAPVVPAGVQRLFQATLRRNETLMADFHARLDDVATKLQQNAAEAIEEQRELEELTARLSRAQLKRSEQIRARVLLEEYQAALRACCADLRDDADNEFVVERGTVQDRRAVVEGFPHSHEIDAYFDTLERCARVGEALKDGGSEDE